MRNEVHAFVIWGGGGSDQCNTNTNSYAKFFASVYPNDTGLESETNFTVAEIENFEITD
jgi:hypothetical protein